MACVLGTILCEDLTLILELKTSAAISDGCFMFPIAEVPIQDTRFMVLDKVARSFVQ